jgi:hypothetical protein
MMHGATFDLRAWGLPESAADIATMAQTSAA